MKITLNEAEIKQAVRLFVIQQGITVTGKEVEVTFTNGRNEGLTADLNITDLALTSETAPNVGDFTPAVEEAKAPVVNESKPTETKAAGKGKATTTAPLAAVEDTANVFSTQASETKPVEEVTGDEAPVVVPPTPDQVNAPSSLFN